MFFLWHISCTWPCCWKLECLRSNKYGVELQENSAILWKFCDCVQVMIEMWIADTGDGWDVGRFGDLVILVIWWLGMAYDVASDASSGPCQLPGGCCRVRFTARAFRERPGGWWVLFILCQTQAVTKLRRRHNAGIWLSEDDCLHEPCLFDMERN